MIPSGRKSHFSNVSSGGHYWVVNALAGQTVYQTDLTIA